VIENIWVRKPDPHDDKYWGKERDPRKPPRYFKESEFIEDYEDWLDELRSQLDDLRASTVHQDRYNAMVNRGDKLLEENKQLREAIEISVDEIKQKLYDAWFKAGVQKGGTLLEYEKDRRILEDIRIHIKKYPNERDPQYTLKRHLPHTAGPRVFNSVLFLTHLETWYKDLEEILGGK